MESSVLWLISQIETKHVYTRHQFKSVKNHNAVSFIKITISLYCRCRCGWTRVTSVVVPWSTTSGSSQQPTVSTSTTGNKARCVFMNPRSVCQRGVRLCAESLISRISPRKRIFQQNQFSLFIRGSGGMEKWRKKCQKILCHCNFKPPYSICFLCARAMPRAKGLNFKEHNSALPL